MLGLAEPSAELQLGIFTHCNARQLGLLDQVCEAFSGSGPCSPPSLVQRAALARAKRFRNNAPLGVHSWAGHLQKQEEAYEAGGDEDAFCTQELDALCYTGLVETISNTVTCSNTPKLNCVSVRGT